MVNDRTLTLAMIYSRDFNAGKRRAENEVLVPPGPKIAVTGGLDFDDRRLIWDRLDRIHAKHPDMVLLHGGSPKGAERIASRWADHRKVPQIAFKPDWTRHAKGGAVQAQRRDAGGSADRGDGVPGHGYPRESTRQGQEARNTSMVLRP
jgi:hypothetical protein